MTFLICSPLSMSYIAGDLRLGPLYHHTSFSMRNIEFAVRSRCKKPATVLKAGCTVARFTLLSLDHGNPSNL